MTAQHQASATAPPESTDPALVAVKKRLSSTLSGWLLPLLQRVAPDHVGGETLDDALGVAARLAGEGYPCTLGFWDTPDYTARQIADIYLESIERAGTISGQSYISIKPPALDFDPRVADNLAGAAAARGIRLHCDSHGPEVADPSCAMIEAMLARAPDAAFGTTLPGRWSRSLADADWAIGHGLSLRVVKGQWLDPQDPERGLREGFLEVVDRLAGRARHVAVASHDVPLVADAVARLRAAGTSCEVEVIHGAPLGPALRWAEQNRVPARIYIPFGKGFIPNALRAMRRDPRLACRIAKGFLAASAPGRPAPAERTGTLPHSR